MTQALSIGASALDADMAAINTTAENVANAQTPAYVRESADLSALPGAGQLGVGDGVEVTTIAQATSALLSANNWQAQGALANLGSLQQTLTAIENVFPLATQAATSSSSGTSATSSASISGQLATFWSAWDAIAQNPSSSAPRVQVVDDAQSLVVGLHEASTQLTQIGTGAQQELADQVSQVNTLLGQVASLNGSILATGASQGGANQLEDQLQSVLATLSQLAGVDVRPQTDGVVDVSIGGVTLVQGTTATTVALQTQGGTTAVVATTGDIGLAVGSGSVAGLLSAVNRYLPQFQSQLDSVADALKTVVNTQLAAGYTATGASATAPRTPPVTPPIDQLFVGSGAASLAVNPAIATDPSLLAASETPGPAAANNGGNAQAMAELGTLLTGPDAAYQAMVQNIGADTQSVDNQLQAQTAVATQAHQALQAVTGVDLTQELTNLLGFQQNYEASAKLLNVVDATIQSLLQAV